jgi:hypothetical protein
MSDTGLFDSAVEMFRETANETARVIPQDQTALFVNLSNDALLIGGAVQNAYPQDELLTSLVLFDLGAIHHQIFGMGFDFWCGRYAEVGRALRFAWESIFRAFYADHYLILKPGAKDPPGSSLDEKTEWLDQWRQPWNTIVLPVLRHTFSNWSEEELRGHFRPLWDRLNSVAHPSHDWRISGVGESARHIWFHFDEQLARQLLADASEVFSLIWLVVAQRFPDAVPALVADPNAFLGCPQVRAVLEQAQQVC